MSTIPSVTRGNDSFDMVSAGEISYDSCFKTAVILSENMNQSKTQELAIKSVRATGLKPKYTTIPCFVAPAQNGLVKVIVGKLLKSEPYAATGKDAAIRFISWTYRFNKIISSTQGFTIPANDIPVWKTVAEVFKNQSRLFETTMHDQETAAIYQGAHSILETNSIIAKATLSNNQQQNIEENAIAETPAPRDEPRDPLSIAFSFEDTSNDQQQNIDENATGNNSCLPDFNSILSNFTAEAYKETENEQQEMNASFGSCKSE